MSGPARAAGVFVRGIAAGAATVFVPAGCDTDVTNTNSCVAHAEINVDANSPANPTIVARAVTAHTSPAAGAFFSQALRAAADTATVYAYATYTDGLVHPLFHDMLALQ